MTHDMGWAVVLAICAVIFGLLCLAVAAFKSWHDANYLRIPPQQMDAAYRTRMFHVPTSMMDMKSRGEAS